MWEQLRDGFEHRRWHVDISSLVAAGLSVFTRVEVILTSFSLEDFSTLGDFYTLGKRFVSLLFHIVG